MFRSLKWVAPLLVALVGRPSWADGIAAYRDASGWHLLSERGQLAVAVLDQGVEHLLLQVLIDEALDKRGANRVTWITPIPARADQIRVAALRGLPSFTGTQPADHARSTLRTLLELMAGSQLWTVPALMARPWGGGIEADGPSLFPAPTTHDGVELELLSAASIDGLAAHLIEDGVELEPHVLEKLQAYATIDQAFVILRIADFTTYSRALHALEAPETSLGLEVTFPTSQGYFPLVASSALRGSAIDVEVTTLGFSRAIEPEPAGLITEYYVGSYDAVAEVRQASNIEISTDHERYTRFRLSSPPNRLTHDLHFEPGAPPATDALARWVSHPYHAAFEGTLALLGFIVLGFVAFWIARPIWPKASRPTLGRCATMALANVCTLAFPLVLMSRYANTNGVSTRRALGCVMTASVILCAMLLLTLITLGK